MARSFDRDQPVVVINARTRKRQLIWAEIDSNPADPEDVTLIIRPGSNFDEGERYIVALRRLKTGGRHGDRPARGVPRLPRRADDERARHRGAARPLRADLQTPRPRRASRATTSTCLGLHGGQPRRAYRPRAARSATTRSPQLGDTNLADLHGPGRRAHVRQNPVDRPTASAASAGHADRELRRPRRRPRVRGRTPPRAPDHRQITVPCYLDQPGCPPGSRSPSAPTACPGASRATRCTANVICTMPRRPSTRARRRRGALVALRPRAARQRRRGRRGARPGVGNEHDFVFCATDWIGMSDLPTCRTC